ncbi:hypothetical protein HZS_1607 [Henneguya salminicola]|nr:hypothetical protein HZS_1607 [Henneguya salminicola]
MNENGLKETIRSKLVQLGKYSDGLPDYITLMIRNKKDTEIIRKDLEIFLGELCDSFVQWLTQNFIDNSSQIPTRATQMIQNTKYNPIKDETKIISMKKENSDHLDQTYNENKIKQFKQIMRKAAESTSPSMRTPIKNNLQDLLNHFNIDKKMETSDKMDIDEAVSTRIDSHKEIFYHETKLPHYDLRHKLERRKLEKISKDQKQIKTPTYITPISCNRELNGFIHCSFDHPGASCIHFPACALGRNCKFAHPICKYNQQ